MKAVNLFIFFIFLFTLFSCERIKNEKKIGENFYQFLKIGDYKKALTLIDSSTFVASPAEQWEMFFREKNKKYGNILSYELKSFYKYSRDGASFTKVKYRVVTKQNVLYEYIEFQTINGLTKIIHYEYDENDFELKEEA